MEITTILTLTTIVGFALSVGKKEGQILTEFGNIKSGIDDMKHKMESMKKATFRCDFGLFSAYKMVTRRSYYDYYWQYS